jgi:hypothetical protein
MATGHEKALRINLDPTIYGTFAEIGAGQEVARWFFHVGGAAGTVAETVSAYDMAVSTARYGKASRFVSRERLRAMLECEWKQLLARLEATRGDRCTFFVFADTVATRSYSRDEDGSGWLGVRFQQQPGGPPSEVLLHVHLLDPEPVRQQEDLGLLGLNLLYGTFFHQDDPPALVRSLLDGLHRSRVEIDVLSVSGPAFAKVDNRLVALSLVENGLTDAAMFTAEGEVVQPSEVLYKRAILLARGAFRPVTRLGLDIMERAQAQFLTDAALGTEAPVLLAELSFRDLSAGGSVDHADFLARADMLRTLGPSVMISRFGRYFALADHLARYTTRPIGVAVGLPGLIQIVTADHYEDLPGGLLEAAGRLFKQNVTLYVYPGLDPAGEVMTMDSVPLGPPAVHLKEYLVAAGRLRAITGCNKEYLAISADAVLDRIRAGDPSWEPMVPPPVAEVIRRERLFGCR